MDNREEALIILNELGSCRQNSLITKMEEAQKGIHFVLIYLHQAKGAVLAGDLARETGVSTARIAAILRSMEKSGLVTRHRGVVDARHTVVEITDAGNELVYEMKEQLLQKIEMLLEKVGKEEIEEFIRISHKIKSVLNE